MKKILLLTSTSLSLMLLSIVACNPQKEPTPPPTPIDPPSDMSVTADSSSIEVVWTADANATSYEAQLVKAEQAPIIKKNDKPILKFTDLESDTEYQLRVRACYSNDDSGFSEWQKVATKEGQIAKMFKQGAGSKELPYIIKTAPQLALLAKVTNDQTAGFIGKSVFYELGADIDLTGYDWMPIGNGFQTDNNAEVVVPVPAFEASLDGKQFTVKGLSVNLSRADVMSLYGGLFGANRGKITFVNVEGTLFVENKNTDPNASTLAGGLTGFNAIISDGTTPISGTGTIENCTFVGQVKSIATTAGVAAMAGGIVGGNSSGNVDFCQVTVPDQKVIEANGLGSISAGGICGFLGAGRVESDKVIVEGSVAAIANHTLAGAVGSYHAGGICGSMQTTSMTQSYSGFGNCVATIKGSILATGDVKGAIANAGGLAGSVYDAMCGMGNVDISGEVTAIGDIGANVGGVIGNLNDGQIGSCNVVNSGMISAISTGTSNSDVVYAAGVVGRCGAKVLIAYSSFVCTGEIYVESGSASFVGGVAASGGGHQVNYALFDESAMVTVIAAKDIAIGGVVGNGTGATFAACYAINKAEMLLNTSAVLSYGGLSGVFGSSVGAATRSARSCYAITSGNMMVDGEPSAKKMGGIFGSSGTKGTANNCHWWGNSEWLLQGDGGNASKAGVTAIASNDKAGLEAVAIELNAGMDAIGNISQRYTYNATLGYLELL